jgi:hypothetical protein
MTTPQKAHDFASAKDTTQPAQTETQTDPYASFRFASNLDITPTQTLQTIKPFAGTSDVQIVNDGDLNPSRPDNWHFDSPGDSGRPVAENNSHMSAGELQLERDKADIQFNDEGGSYKVKIDGKEYRVNRVEGGFFQPDTYYAINLDGTVMEDLTLQKKIEDQVSSIMNRERAREWNRENPLDQQQQQVFDEMVDALATGDYTKLAQAAHKLNNDPSKFDAVFEHLLAETILNEKLSNITLGWGFNNMNNSGALSVTVGGTRPIAVIKLGQEDTDENLNKPPKR